MKNHFPGSWITAARSVLTSTTAIAEVSDGVVMTGIRLVTGLCLAGAASVASAQYPNKPITLVVPYQAGGSSDALGRTIAEAASKELGQPIIVENKPGAEGQLGSQDVAKSAPDGYRILLAGAGSLVVVPELRKVPPYDAVKDFTPIAGVADFSFFLYVHPSVPANNMREFVEYAKANPGKLNYGTGSNTSLLSFAHVNKVLGLDLVRVSYKGEPAAFTDVLTGRVHAIFGTTAGIPHVKSGKFRALVTTLTKRSAVLPDVPTMRESGFPDIPFGGGWLAIFGPPGMPKDIVERLNKAFVTGINRPDIHTKLEQLGLAPTPMKAEELGAYTRDQRIMYRQAVKEVGMPVE